MEYIIKSNSYRILNKKIKELTQNIDKENITYYDLEIDDLKNIIEECNYTSLFNEKKVIIVYNSYIFNTKHEYKEELNILDTYLENPNTNTTLIFLTENISLRKKSVKHIKEKNNLIELNMPEKQELEQSIKDYLKDNNYKIENSALNKLIDNLNSNYDYILNELDKLFIVKKDYLITLLDIEKYTINIKEENIFDFVNLVIKKDIKKIYQNLDKIINEKIEPSIIFSSIANQYRLIYSVKNLIKEGYTEKKIATELDIHPYRIKLAHENAYNYSNEELENKILSIGSIDNKIKLGLIDKYNALKIFLIDL